MEKPILFPKPELEFVFSMEYKTKDNYNLGKMAHDLNEIHTIKYGYVEGQLKGSFKEGSGNWITKTEADTIFFDGKYMVETEDKMIVPFDVNGTILADGVIRARVFFHSGHKKYQWLNQARIVAVGKQSGDCYRLDCYALENAETMDGKGIAFFEKPKLEHLYYIHVKVGEIMMAGNMAEGRHMVIPILEGRFEGDRVKGDVIHAGADWNYMKFGIPMVSHVSTRYVLHTDDGAYISLFTDGYMNMGIPGMIAMLKNKPDPLKTYFKQHLHYHTGDERYTWMNRELFMAIISPTPEQNICYDAYQVLF